MKQENGFEWPRHPVLYEMNTAAWLYDLSARAGRPVTLGSVPQEEIEKLAGLGFDGICI